MEPSVKRAGGRQTYAAAGAGVLALGGLAYVGFVDPHRTGSLFPPCPFKLLTGLDCPACGGLRMTHDLLHGDLAAAVTDNVFLLVGLPGLIAWMAWRRHTGKPLAPPAMLIAIAVAAIAWTVVRNWPGFPLVPTTYGGG